MALLRQTAAADKGVRLLGVTASGFESENQRDFVQPPLFAPAAFESLVA